MASPQTENGYTKIANELLDALCGLQLSGHEWSVVHSIIRKTYGYNKKEDWVTNTQIADLTGLHRVRVSEAKMKLLAKGVVTEKRNKISLVKDYDKWVLLRKSVTKVVTEKRNTVTEKRNKVLRKSVPTKDNKDNKTKDTSKHSLQDVQLVDMKNLIPEVIKAFELVDPKNKTYYGNKTQRGACEFLLTEYGFEEVIKRISFLSRSNDMEYFPTITTPVQLRDKWVSLEKAVGRIKNKSNTVAF